MKRSIFLVFLVFLLALQYSCSKDTNSDKNKPFIILNGNPFMNWPLGTEFVDPGANVYDIDANNDTIDISFRLNITNEVDVDVEGSYEIKYNAQDENGNNADEKIRTVKVLISK